MGWRTGLWLLPFALALQVGAAQPLAADRSPGEWRIRLGDHRLRERILAARALRTAGAPAAHFEAVLRSLPEPGSPEQRRDIRELVGQLGDRRYAARVHASRELLRIGLPACGPLEAAARSGDLETRVRARELLEGHLGPELERARLEAALALGHLGRSESTAWLQSRLAATEGDPLTRVASEAALGGLVPASAVLGDVDLVLGLDQVWARRALAGMAEWWSLQRACRGGRLHWAPLATGAKVGPGAVFPGPIHARTVSHVHLPSDSEWVADQAAAAWWDCETEETIRASSSADPPARRSYGRHSWTGYGFGGRAVFHPGPGQHDIRWGPSGAWPGRFSKLTCYGWLLPMPAFPENHVGARVPLSDAYLKLLHTSFFAEGVAPLDAFGHLACLGVGDRGRRFHLYAVLSGEARLERGGTAVLRLLLQGWLEKDGWPYLRAYELRGVLWEEIARPPARKARTGSVRMTFERTRP